jgi:hypothetical protein
MIVPKHIQIETINGVCTAHCKMCTIENWRRKPHVMDDLTYNLILEKLKPYCKQINYLTLHFCGGAFIR